ncbi:hypothetical protein [Shimia sp. Alg240-R146]|uniref:hypothetical protein n=1 Tax=Shimia sp. Alg240-R146 TaxID=2993449 RepID=UPI0022DF9195|nr:hypothetical protein [Shimia sp. Alg240-R146]
MFKQLSYSLRLLAIPVALVLASPAAAADCYADYKAKKDNPLRLHYGVVALRSGCDKPSARAEVANRIAKDGWTLLNVLSVFDETELSGKEASAGQFYLFY